MNPYIFQRGETVAIALDCVTGDPATAGAVTADLKPVASGRSGVDPGTPVVASFSVSVRAASGDAPAGWTLTLAAEDCAALASGSYLADARIVIGGGVVITDPVAIRIVEAVTVS